MIVCKSLKKATFREETRGFLIDRNSSTIVVVNFSQGGEGMVNKLKRQLFFLVCIAFLAVSWVSADEYNGTMDLFESSPVLKPYFDNSFGYAVFPRVGKGEVMNELEALKRGKAIFDFGIDGKNSGALLIRMEN